ncbi:MAG: hypothetical protein M1503_06660 [Thaumarchaeota archaeon]|nr:hypothetical protein [Nitrososphaerota archaeon]MCL5317923.1 hypothetical protein [Nitrososphaerota archaeon]
MKAKDKVESVISEVVTSANEPLETKEIHEKVQQALGENVGRSKLLYRLNDLRGQGEIAGKYVGSGKGVWIWWKKNLHK